MLELLWQLRNKRLWGAAPALRAVFGPDCFRALYTVAWALQVGRLPVAWPGGSKLLHALAAHERSAFLLARWPCALTRAAACKSQEPSCLSPAERVVGLYLLYACRPACDNPCGWPTSALEHILIEVPMPMLASSLPSHLFWAWNARGSDHYVFACRPHARATTASRSAISRTRCFHMLRVLLIFELRCAWGVLPRALYPNSRRASCYSGSLPHSAALQGPFPSACSSRGCRQGVQWRLKTPVAVLESTVPQDFGFLSRAAMYAERFCSWHAHQLLVSTAGLNCSSITEVLPEAVRR